MQIYKNNRLCLHLSGESKTMNKNDRLIVIVGVLILLVSSIGIYTFVPDTYGAQAEKADAEELASIAGEFKQLPQAITVSDEDPFYALIATPLAVHYCEEGTQTVIPLYIENMTEASSAVERAEEMIGIEVDQTIGCSFNQCIKNVSLEIAEKFWEQSKAALLIENTQEGYNLGVPATIIASYLSIPVIVTDEIDAEVRDTLRDLGVIQTFICGEGLTGYGKEIRFENLEEILDLSIELVEEKFGSVEYITLTNPMDIAKAEVLDTETHHFEGTLTSNSFTPTNFVNMMIGMLRGIPFLDQVTFEVPEDYKYARITLYAHNDVDEDVEETGSQLQPMIFDPNDNWLALAFTVGGIPERDSSGGIVKDHVEWNTITYDNPGEYYINLAGQYIASKTGKYEVDVTVEKLNSSIVPNMPGLSSTAPYLTAYHKGILYANPDFTFVADERIVPNPPSGVAFPASNPDLIDDVNEHVFEIHESLNEILARLQHMNLTDDDDLENLKKYYDKYPMHIALVGDARMIPQYYYYDTPDAITTQYGWDVASDFIYGNVDPIPRDDYVSIHPKDKFLSNYDEKYPHQENIVGRLTGWDAQDVSALIARTVFYENIIEDMNDWKRTAVVQTGSGTDFQRIYGIDFLRKVLNAHDPPFKWPTGEAHFHNLIIQDQFSEGNFEVSGTENSYSMRRGHSDETLTQINRLGILNFFLFPKYHAKAIIGEDKISGGVDQIESNFIFSFGHGQPMGYSHGDAQTASMGFRPLILHNIFNRWFFGVPIMPPMSTGLGNVGGYNVRAVSNMELGPSVMFVESCYIGRFDGFPAKCLVSQSYIHAGVNSFIASSRGSPGPGYLDARRSAKGFGLSEWIKTQLNPDLQQPHFSSLLAVNMYDDLIDNDVDVGTAFRNSRNKFMDDAETEFFWTPPLSLQISTQSDIDMIWDGIESSVSGDARCMEKKYTCQLEYNLLGDPAFNPYEPINE